MKPPPERLEALVELARRARRGGRADLEELLRQSAGFVHAVARGRLGNSLAAEGAAVDALARAARALPRLKDVQSYPAWLYRIAVRCAADARSRSGAVDIGPLDPVDPAAGPADVLVAVERSRTVRDAVTALPTRQRDVVLLHFVEGLSYREIACVQGIALGTVARRMKRALGALKQALGGVQ
ncbi:MAG: RNA polymerase sigma factor [Planctomycetota bacterium]|nr:RNA polymerase sigma factor [Planctomycetota bacterium]